VNSFLAEEVARLLAERGTPLDPPIAPTEFAWYSHNVDTLAPVMLDQSHNARAWRKIKRIAAKYSWGAEVIKRAMDDAGAWTEDALPTEDIDALLIEMQRQDDRAMSACDMDDAPPAR